MNVVLKYVVQHDMQRFIMPAGAQIVHIREQNEVPVIWALVNADPNHPKEARSFKRVGTGEHIEPSAQYRGTVHLDRERNIVHIFETFDIPPRAGDPSGIYGA